MRVKSRVTAIDRKNKSVTVESEGRRYEEGYDRLLIATGAEPYRAPFPGAALPGVFTLRSLEDAEAIKKWIIERGVRKAVVIGGGYIGIETAENLKNRGIETYIVEMGEQLMTPFDPEVANRVRQCITKNGISVQTACKIERIDDENGLTVQMCPEKVPADVVILSAGVRPDTNIAHSAGLDMNRRGSIVVDNRMRTSDPDIYAVGDAVQITNFVTKEPDSVLLAGPANRQGRIAAENIAGGYKLYDGAQGSGVLKVFEMTAACTGITETKARSLGIECGAINLEYPSHAHYYPGAADIFMKVVFEKGTGRILGAQLTGEDGVDKRCDVMAAAIRMGATASDLTRFELCYAPPFGTPKDIVNVAGDLIEKKLGAE